MEKDRAEESLTKQEIREEIEELRVAHRELETRLDELNAHVYLTPAEQFEEHRIKKLKLQKKDRMRELEHMLGVIGH